MNTMTQPQLTVTEDDAASKTELTFAVNDDDLASVLQRLPNLGQDTLIKYLGLIASANVRTIASLSIAEEQFAGAEDALHDAIATWKDEKLKDVDPQESWRDQARRARAIKMCRTKAAELRLLVRRTERRRQRLESARRALELALTARLTALAEQQRTTEVTT
jgi:hypothetical protein